MLGFGIVVIVLSIFYILYQFGHLFGWFESGVGAEKLSEDIAKRQRYNKKRRAEYAKLERYRVLTDYFASLLFSPIEEFRHEYIVIRMGIKSKVLDKVYTAKELRGKYIEKLLIGIVMLFFAIYVPAHIFFALVFGALLAWYICEDYTLELYWGIIPLVLVCVLGSVVSPCLVVGVFGIASFIGYKLLYTFLINYEDEILDRSFSKMFLIMHSQLRLGSHGSLTVAVKSYLNSIDGIRDSEEQKVMRKFAEYLLNQLSMYPDDVAVAGLTHYYKSAMIVNFCNVATQALQGTDNRDTLLTYKMEVIRASNEESERRAEKACEVGQRNILLLYVILAFIVILGWVSKIPFDYINVF